MSIVQHTHPVPPKQPLHPAASTIRYLVYFVRVRDAEGTERLYYLERCFTNNKGANTGRGVIIGGPASALFDWTFDGNSVQGHGPASKVAFPYLLSQFQFEPYVTGPGQGSEGAVNWTVYRITSGRLPAFPNVSHPPIDPPKTAIIFRVHASNPYYYNPHVKLVSNRKYTMRVTGAISYAPFETYQDAVWWFGSKRPWGREGGDWPQWCPPLALGGFTANFMYYDYRFSYPYNNSHSYLFPIIGTGEPLLVKIVNCYRFEERDGPARGYFDFAIYD